MRKQVFFFRLLGIAVMLSSVSMPLVAGVITFHPEESIYGGSGCPEGASRIYLDEYGELVMEHNAMIIDLPAYGYDHALSARKSCSIRMPVTIQQGFYVKSIEQRLTYAAIKSAGAQAQIATRTAISSDRVSPFLATLSRGEEYYGDMMIDSRRDYLESAAQIHYYCRPDRSEQQMLQVNLVISAQRDSVGEDLVVQTHGGYLGEGLEIEVEPCP